MLTYRILGTLDVLLDGEPVALGAPTLRVVLAALLVRRGRPVGRDELAERLWGDERVRGEKQAVQTYVMRLRQRLGRDAVVTTPQGYVVDAGVGTLDAADAEDLARRADAAAADGDPATAARLLRAAADLWRGAPLADVPSDSLHREVVPRLVEAHLARVERRVDLELGLGGGDDLVAELRGLTAEHPFRESLWALLMRALYASGRQADALETYREIASRLGDELGLDPGAELRRVHQDVLTGTLPRAEQPGSWRVPRELPARVRTFVGRAAERSRVRDWLGETAPIVVVSGGPGVGKSAFVTQCAHDVADRFPDGQLYLDLRGFTPGTPVSVEEALRRLLRGLGLVGEQVPTEVDEQIAAYRSLLAGRRVLVVADNAVAAEQVRPLVPGESGCAVLVTSRNQLRGLVALDGARLLPLDPLPDDEAELLVAALVGGERAADEPSSVRDLVRACGALPLALRIAGANLAGRPHARLSGYVDELAGHGGLDRLRTGDGTAVAAAFDLSYGALPDATRRLFRLLGLVPGPDVTLPAAEVLDAAPGTAGRLDALVAASLVQPYADGRYRMHDLVRVFAAGRVDAEETADDRRVARERLFRWYLRMVDAAIVPHRQVLNRLPREAPPEDVFPDGASGIRWVDVELPNLAAAVVTAATEGPYELSWHLADALRGYYLTAGHQVRAGELLDAALRAADAHGGHRERGAIHGALGSLRLGGSDFVGAVASLQRAAEEYHLAGDEWGEIANLSNAAMGYSYLCRYREAAAGWDRALDMVRRAGTTRGRVTILSNVATVCLETGRLADAEAALDEAAELGVDGTAEQIGAHAVRAALSGLRGDVAGMRALARTTLDSAHRLGEWYKESILRVELARNEASWGAVDLAKGHAEVAARIDRVTDAAVDAALTLAMLTPDPDLTALAADVERRARPLGQTRYLCCLGWAALRRGAAGEAAETAERALAEAEGYGLAYWQCDALAVLVAALVELGDRPGAERAADRALARCDDCGFGTLPGRVLAPLADAEPYRSRWEQLVASYPAWTQSAPLGGV